MLKNPFCNIVLAGVNLNTYGELIPSPFTQLSLSNSEISSMTSWTLRMAIAGDDKRKINVAGLEALLYSAAQEASNYDNNSGYLYHLHLDGLTKMVMYLNTLLIQDSHSISK